jgi:streptogramin lyase
MARFSWRNWLVFASQRKSRKRPRATFRPQIENLEDRMVPSGLPALGTTALVEGPTAGTDSDLVATSGAWTATANVPWLHTNASGTGSGLATFTFDANTGATRTGTLTIAGQSLTVTQAGATYLPANQLTTLASAVAGPYGVAVDAKGNIYIADTSDSAIKEYNAVTGQVSTLVSDGLFRPTGVAVDAAGNVYITDGAADTLSKYNTATGQITTLIPYVGTYAPWGVAVDASGNVIIADIRTNAIEKYDTTTGQISTLVSGLNDPEGVAVDVAGNVIIADTDNNELKKYSTATGQVSTLISTMVNGP